MNKLKFAKLEKGFQSNNRFHNVPALILTVGGCNLKCISNGELCKYAFPNLNKISVNEAKEFINNNKSINHIVIQGGEPLLYKEELESFLNDVWRDGMFITIHTNGTLPILNPLTNKYKISLYIVNIGDNNLPEAGTKIINPMNNKEFVFGTTDIEKMNTLDIDKLRNLCTYSSDYLLCFSADPDKLESFSTSVIEEICKTDDEFLDNLLKNYSPYKHIAYRPRNTKEIKKVQELCLETGKYYCEINN